MNNARLCIVNDGCLIHDESACAGARTRRPWPSGCATIWYPSAAATCSACPTASPALSPSPSVVHDSSSTITSEPNDADLRHVVVGPAPAVHPAVHVVVGDGEHDVGADLGARNRRLRSSAVAAGDSVTQPAPASDPDGETHPILARRLRPFTTTIFATMSELATATNSVNLGQGFPDTDGPEDLKEIAADAILHGNNQYPPSAGIPELRRAVAAHQRAWYDLDLTPTPRSSSPSAPPRPSPPRSSPSASPATRS